MRNLERKRNFLLFRHFSVNLSHISNRPSVSQISCLFNRHSELIEYKSEENENPFHNNNMQKIHFDFADQFHCNNASVLSRTRKLNSLRS